MRKRAPQRQRVADGAGFLQRRDDHHVAEWPHRVGERVNSVRRNSIVIGDQNQWHESLDLTALIPRTLSPEPSAAPAVYSYNPDHELVALARRRTRSGGGRTGHAKRLLHHLLRPGRAHGWRAGRARDSSPRAGCSGSLFTALSVAYLVVFRGRFQARFEMPPPPNVDSLVGGLAIVQERLLPGVVGRVEVRGSSGARGTSATSCWMPASARGWPR